jgi:pimeloyl-ACP methyl ester carboxylesterase
VGRIDRLVTDPDRRNRYAISTNGSFAISVWYPAAPTAGQRPARWFDEVVVRDTSPTSCWALWESTEWLDRLPYLCTYSFSDAPLAEVSGTFPVVLFSPGYTVDRRADAEKLESLASQGYVVVAVDHYDALAAAWPDGFYHSQGRVSQIGGLEDRVRDFVVVLDELTKWNRTDARFAGRLGLDRIGAMGFSWGGPTVAELAQQDARCQAVVLLDPGGPGGTLQGFSRPSLTMLAPDNSDQEVFAASQTNAVWFQISNTDHASFVNYVVFGSVPLATNREAVRTMNAYTLSFFNKWLKGQDDSLHEGSSPEFPRIINFHKK